MAWKKSQFISNGTTGDQNGSGLCDEVIIYKSVNKNT